MLSYGLSTCEILRKDKITRKFHDYLDEADVDLKKKRKKSQMQVNFFLDKADTYDYQNFKLISYFSFF
jgi:hypothetical protein